MECVDHREAGGDEFRGNSHPPESVGQDGPTKTLAPQTCIDREAASRTAGTSAGLPRPRLSQPAVEFGLTRIQGVDSVPRGVQWLGSKDHGSG